MGFGGKTLFTDLGFEMKKGDKTALVGPNGVGKTTLIKLLVKQYTPQAGHVREGVNVRIGYYDQNTALSEEKNVFQEMADTYPRLTQTEIRTTLGAFMFIGDDVFKPISALSGGERGRVQLAKIMLAGSNFLVLDEPTNHLDIFSKNILEEALREFTGTLLYISHDRYFINNTANKVLDLSANGLVAYDGNYDYYIEKKAAQIALGHLKPTESDTRTQETGQKEDYRQKKANSAAERKRRAHYAQLEKTIAATEAAIAECDTKLNDLSVASDFEQAQEFYNKKTELEAQLMELYESWEELQ